MPVERVETPRKNNAKTEGKKESQKLAGKGSVRPARNNSNRGLRAQQPQLQDGLSKDSNTAECYETTRYDARTGEDEITARFNNDPPQERTFTHRPNIMASNTITPAQSQWTSIQQPGLVIPPRPLKRQAKPSRLNISTIASNSPISKRPYDTGTATQSEHAASGDKLQRSLSDAQSPITPMIVITPADESFDDEKDARLALPSQKTRAASSMYSNFSHRSIRTPRNISNTHGEVKSVRHLREEHTDSVCTVFEEDPSPPISDDHTSTLTPPMLTSNTLDSSQKSINSSPRSVGWWNMVMPNSAHSNAFFWLTPKLGGSDDGDREAILDDDLSECSGSEPSSPSVRSSNASMSGFSIRRSLDLPEVAWSPIDDTIDIYRIPSHGEAAAYYDSTRNFPSLYIEPESGVARSLAGVDTPHLDAADEHHDRAIPNILMTDDHEEIPHQSVPTSKVAIISNPFDDAASSVGAFSTATKSQAMFTTPRADEMATPALTIATPRNQIQPTVVSEFSPLSPTPILERAHLAHVINPSSEPETMQSFRSLQHAGESPIGVYPAQHEDSPIHIYPSQDQDEPFSHERSLPPTPPHPIAFQGIGGATMNTQRPDSSFARSVEPAFPPFTHKRTSSHGLGITDSQEQLWTPPQTFNEKQRESEEFGRALSPADPYVKERQSRGFLKRYLLIPAAFAAALLIFVIVWLVMHNHQKHQDMAVNGQWMNLTGFPAIPTGILTVAQPKNVRQEGGCVASTPVWSCDAPPAHGTQPSFRLELRFRNNTNLNNSSLMPQKRSGMAALAGALIKERGIMKRDAWSDSLFNASPAPPSVADQEFLGNTTDNNTLPYAGEDTPFYISLLDTTAQITSRKRDTSVYPYPTSDGDSTPSNSSTPTNTTESIPKPVLTLNGTLVDPVLYPLTVAQPLKLYKRGQQDEHYGFYTYFDRSVYISNSSGKISSNVAISDATAVCTWSQTRMLVQIWTKSIVPAPVSNNTSAIASANMTSSPSVPAVNSTANDMVFPGSLPYAITITLDRHGGDGSKKGVYCHSLDGSGHVSDSVKKWLYEDRAFQGSLVNPAAVPTSEMTKRDDNHGGIDGGSGGCACAWQNWT